MKKNKERELICSWGGGIKDKAPTFVVLYVGNHWLKKYKEKCPYHSDLHVLLSAGNKVGEKNRANVCT